MNHRESYYLIILILWLTFSSCSKKNKSKLFKKYYPNGMIRSYGQYINDTIPIDTLFSFYPNGRQHSILVHDSSGRPNGESIFYHDNGNIYQRINYRNGLIQDFFYEFDRNGKLVSKIFFLNSNQLGDSYYYDSKNSNVSAYNFYDFSGRNLNSITYDSILKSNKNIRQRIFIDSVYAYNDSLDKQHEHSYNIYLVVSNPPKSRSVVRIDYKSSKGIIIRTDSVTGIPYYFKKERLPDTVAIINFFASQFDSATNKIIYQSSSNALRY